MSWIKSEALIAYEDECDDFINGSQDQITRQLYHRAHVARLKLTALLAVGRQHLNPSISLFDFKWARTIIIRSVCAVKIRFQSGQIGEYNFQLEQQRLMEDCFNSYLMKPWTPQFERNYLVSKEQKEVYGVITLQYSNSILRKGDPFKESPSMTLASENTLHVGNNANSWRSAMSWVGTRTSGRRPTSKCVISRRQSHQNRSVMPRFLATMTCSHRMTWAAYLAGNDCHSFYRLPSIQLGTSAYPNGRLESGLLLDSHWPWMRNFPPATLFRSLRPRRGSGR